MRIRSFLVLASALALVAAAGCSSSSPATDSPSAPTGGNDAGDAVSASDTKVCASALPTIPVSNDPKCPVVLPPAPDALDDALKSAGLDRCTLGYTAKDWSIYGDLAHDPYRLPWYDGVHDHALRAPSFGNTMVAALDDAAASKMPVAGALQVASFGMGSQNVPCAEPFTLDETQPLARAVAQVIEGAGGTPDQAALEADAADVPLPFQRALARVILAANEAQATWDTLAKGFTPADLLALGKVHAIHLRSLAGPPDLTRPNVQSLLSKRFDSVALAEGGVKLALRIESANLAQFAGLRGFSFEQETPLGRIVIADAADQVHAKGSHVLVMVDTGGNDTYRFPAGAVDAVAKGEAAHHVGLAFDLAGRDTYAYDEVPDPKDGARLPSDGAPRLTPSDVVAKDDGPVSLSETLRQGAARLGYGMLFDFGDGDDTYRSLRLSQGYGAAGVGVLYDQGGSDHYDGEAGVQGATHFGIGLLLDAAGDDTYRSYSQTQGFSSVRGVGILYDRDGKDQYLADNGDPADGGDPLYWTIQIPGKGNNSFAQGAAFGRRSPGGGDDVDMSGGLAILRDRAGDDVYVASVQAQSSGYWFGTGILADGSGNDTYDARYYVQGAGAHFAMALFLEGGGDDKYNMTFAPHATSIGVGHDFTVAWHVDLGGNDVYRGPLLSLGSGNANGIGILLNVGGDDVYHSAAEPTIGAANFSGEWHDACSACSAVATTGIFMDVGGKDTYDVGKTGNPVIDGTEPVVRTDDKSWADTRSPAEWKVTEHAAGVDRATGTIALP